MRQQLHEALKEAIQPLNTRQTDEFKILNLAARRPDLITGPEGVPYGFYERSHQLSGDRLHREGAERGPRPTHTRSPGRNTRFLRRLGLPIIATLRCDVVPLRRRRTVARSGPLGRRRCDEVDLSRDGPVGPDVRRARPLSRTSQLRRRRSGQLRHPHPVGPGHRQVRNNRVTPAVDLISLMIVLLGPAAGHRGEMKPGHGSPIHRG